MRKRIAKKDLLHNIHRVLHGWMGTNVILLDLIRQKDGFEVRLGVVKTHICPEKNGPFLRYRTYEIKQTILLRVKDGAYWLEWPDDYRSKIAISRKEREILS